MFPQLESRRATRLPIRAPAVLATGTDRWQVIAEDFAAGGCRIVSPVPLRRGAAAWLTLQLPSGAGEVAAAATVAWATPTAPYRIGFEFARAGTVERARQARALMEADPALAYEPPPLPPSLRLRLGEPPDAGAVFSRDERAVLRAGRDAVSLRDLHARHPSRTSELRRATVALLSRGLVEEGAPRASDPRWATVLAGDEPEAPTPAPARPPLDPWVAPRLGRGRRAQAFVDLARAESVAGHDASAVEWLQAALAAAPEDPELIAALDALTVPRPRR